MLIHGLASRLAAIAAVALIVANCAPDESQAAVSSASGSTASARAPARSADAALQLVVAPTGNEVRYRVREQLVGLDLPNDAVGKTSAVTGALSLDVRGQVLAAASRFTVDAATFVSDKDRRDNYVRRRLLTVDAHPTITLVPTALRGLSLPLPSSGSRTLELMADLTVRGVTRPTTWRVTASFADGQVTGTASTAFTFADFTMDKPRVPVVLSVADSIRLEYDFTLLTRHQTGT